MEPLRITNLSISIDLEYENRFNYALYQNYVPFIKLLRLHNNSDEDIDNLTVFISTDPFDSEYSTTVSKVAAQSTYNLDKVNLQFNLKQLSLQNERESGVIQVEIKAKDEIILQETHPFEVFAYNEWCGIHTLPEILAAHVQPNHPELDSFFIKVRDQLQTISDTNSFDGYQSKNKLRVYNQVKAIYDSIHNDGISYINPPASFENTGQKIRPLDQIISGQMGTCLDLSVLFASCIEHAGLYPMIILIEGHSYVGFWLDESYYPDPCIDDLSRLRKSVELNFLKVFETTHITKPAEFTFERSIHDGTALLNSDKNFLYAIDIQSARKRRIRPLPSKVKTDKGIQFIDVKSPQAAPSVIDLEEEFQKNKSQIPDKDSVSRVEAPIDETVPERIQRWKNKLLDLSLRNRLLNFKESKKSLPLISPDLGKLEDALSDGEDFYLHPRSRFLDKRDPRDAEMMNEDQGQNVFQEYIQQEMENNRLLINLSTEELDRRQLEIYRETRLSLEEGGSNTLYLVLGFLKWYESPSSDKELKAPLILVPLQLKRNSAQEAFQLSMLDDEPRFNITLLERLKRDFGIVIDGLDPLPTDDSGIDLDHIHKLVTAAIFNQSRWEVLQESWIGHFTFSKYLMWSDLELHFSDFMEHPVFKHLVEKSGIPFTDGVDFPNENELDQSYPPDTIYCPMDCDSSQLSAIIASAKGKNFVLEGPPGTGKSQTISNLIAHCLAEGKRILFVSEKMAALNVVQDRLQRIGLGPFCLELHSNKTDKKSVLAQLEEALTVEQFSTQSRWTHQTKRLHDLRNDLNKYVESLTKKYPIEKTPFQVISILIGFDDQPGFTLSFSDLLSWKYDQYQSVKDKVANYQTASKSVGDISTIPWRSVGLEEWNPTIESQIRELSVPIFEGISQITENLNRNQNDLPFHAESASKNDLHAIRELTDLLNDPYIPQRNTLEELQWSAIKSQLNEWITIGKKRDKLRSHVFSVFQHDILTCDIRSNIDLLKRAEQGYPPFSWLKTWKVKKQLKPHVSGVLPKGKELVSILENALDINNLQEELNQIQSNAEARIGLIWNHGEANWDEVEHAIDWIDHFHHLLTKLPTGNDEQYLKYKNHWIGLATDLRAKSQTNAALGESLTTIKNCLATIDLQLTELSELLHLDSTLAWGEDQDSGYLNSLQSTLEKWINNPGDLPQWCGYIRAKNTLLKVGLEPLIENVQCGNIKPQNILQTFEHIFYREWYTSLLQHDPVLKDFFSPTHIKLIDDFKQADMSVIELAKKQIQSELSKRIPQSTSVDIQTSELGILKKEIKKKRKHLPIRRLFKETQNLISKIKPCFLMSPLSVAQFLDREFPSFDIIVFDEASQIPVWDSIGAIGRGKQVIVVGDSKQLPPTNFFQIMDDDEFSDDTMIEDMESILDQCSVSGLPSFELKWHYRSRHENLIAFSNYNYYNNKLITFPSPLSDIKGFGVDFRYLKDGIYDKGKSRTNRNEAEAIVDEVFTHLTDPSLQDRSIGIVTFNIAQQQLIEDLLEETRRNNPEIEHYFSNDCNEPVFVKNLENVQGDERDVILLSVCYGPDQQGKFSMNFGPLNRDGGERRLNVAITRARLHVILFSSIRSEDIDLRRTSKLGSEHLKLYLDYAERGPKAISEAITLNPDADFDSPFEKTVYDSLTNKGWKVDIQVGCSGYRIDLAVRHPDHPGEYLIGIECDGANYHSSRVARDRDRLRESVLNGLGWKLHRIWSTDWWQNKNKEIEKLEQVLQQELLTYKPKETDLNLVSNQTKRVASFVPTTEFLEPPKTEFQDNPPVHSKKHNSLPGQKTYTPYSFISDIYDKEKFYEFESNKTIKSQIKEFVEEESPIGFDLLCKYISNQWGIGRTTNKTKSKIQDILDTMNFTATKTGTQSFLWSTKLDPNHYDGFRVPSDGKTRELDTVSKEEFANALASILSQHISAPKVDLLNTTVKLFGYKSVSKKSLTIAEYGLSHLVEKGKCKIENDLVRWQE